MAAITILRDPGQRGAWIAPPAPAGTLPGPLVPQQAAFAFDATLEEGHNESAVATEHPLEDGATVADHIQQLPTELTLTGVVTNTPNQLLDYQPDRDFRAWEALVALLNKGEALTVVTPLKVYRHMALVGAELSRSAESGQAIAPRLTFRQVRTARAELVFLPPQLRASAGGRIAPGAPEAVPPAQAARYRSTLYIATQ